MRRYIVLLLISGTVWAQTNFDSKGWISRDIPADFDKFKSSCSCSKTTTFSIISKKGLFLFFIYDKL